MSSTAVTLRRQGKASDEPFLIPLTFPTENRPRDTICSQILLTPPWLPSSKPPSLLLGQVHSLLAGLSASASAPAPFQGSLQHSQGIPNHNTSLPNSPSVTVKGNVCQRSGVFTKLYTTQLPFILLLPDTLSYTLFPHSSAPATALGSSWNIVGTFLPQGLYTCCFLCMEPAPDGAI